MKIILFFVLIISITAAFDPLKKKVHINDKVFVASYTETITVDLDKKAEERWNIPGPFVDSACAALKEFKSSYYKSILMMFKNDQTKFDEYRKAITDSIDRMEDKDFGKEITSLSQRCDIDYEFIAVMNYTQEIVDYKACTSIPFINNRGETTMITNLDYAFTNIIEKTLFKSIFVKKQQPIFEGLGVFGSLGVLRTYKKNVYATSDNARFVQRSPDDLVKKIKEASFYPISFTLRKANENTSSFKEVKEFLFYNDVFVNAYYSISDLSDSPDTKALIIAKDIDTSLNKTFLLNGYDWFLVQTNYDNDKKDEDGRREGAIKKLHDLGYANSSVSNIYEYIMTESPNFDNSGNERTISTTYIDNEELVCVLWKEQK